MADNFRIYGYFLPSQISGADEQLVGFTSLFLVEGRMFVHYIGLNYNVNKQYHLYARMLYDDIRIALEEGMQCINFGRTAQEIKSTVGATPLKLRSFIKATNPAINLFMPKLVNMIKPAEWVLREPFRKPGLH
jgi:hypothetical protein